MKNLKKCEILLFKNTFFRHMWRHRGRKIFKKYFLKSFYHSRNLKKNFMRIGLLEKKLEGGGQIDPPPAMQPLGKQPAWRRVKREDQTIIFRLRTRHVPLNNHLKRINVKNTATCPLCGYLDETVEHHLFDCVALKELRERFLPSNANIHKCLYDTSEQMRKTCSYFRIASGLRAKAQVPLVR